MAHSEYFLGTSMGSQFTFRHMFLGERLGLYLLGGDMLGIMVFLMDLNGGVQQFWTLLGRGTLSLTARGCRNSVAMAEESLQIRIPPFL